MEPGKEKKEEEEEEEEVVAPGMLYRLVRGGTSSCGARLGEVMGGRLRTPAFLAYARRGLPVHMVEGVSATPTSETAGLHVPLHDIQWLPGEARLRAFNEASRAAGSGEGLAAFTRTEGYVTAVSGRDSLRNELGPSNERAYSFHSQHGRQMVTPAAYSALVRACRPHFYAALADETAACVPRNRTRKSVERTLRWLDECAADTGRGTGALLGTVVGGVERDQRRRCAEEVARRPAVQGFVLGGFDAGETPDERRELLREVVALLPPGRLRWLAGSGAPDFVLDGVAGGCDLFDGAYPVTLTEAGLAATFCVDPLAAGQAGPRATRLNLRDPVLERDAGPMLAGCECYACRTHTRAYVHHLLNTHEILGVVLLQVHNTHHYSVFFEHVRAAVGRGVFPEYREAFLRLFYAA